MAVTGPGAEYLIGAPSDEASTGFPERIAISPLAQLKALSRRGRAVVEKFRPLYEQWRAKLGQDVPEREMAALTRIVDRLISELEQG